MDAELKFYRQNRLLLRFLLIATIVFFVLLAIIFVLEKDNEVKPLIDKNPIQHFSERATVSAVTYGYKTGAKYITDIESYPAVKELFFSRPIPTYSNWEQLSLALKEVEEATSTATQSSDSQVNSTSYYIGNLSILPGLTLHDLLLNESRPETTKLIETALADVRAGTVTIQNYFDEATPNFYNSEIKPAVYFPTPGFPSLTVVEVATVLQVLAKVDEVHARFYEQQLKNYASQVFSSGSNFKVDIEYALKLATIYDSIRQTSPEYASLFKSAKGEWQKTPEISFRTEINPAFNFSTGGFAYTTNRKFTETENWGYKPLYKDETLTGSLRLTLVDSRLTPQRAKLYEYNFVDNEVLPLAIDLRTKEFPILNESVGIAHYYTNNNYNFVTGVASTQFERQKSFSKVKLVKREGDKVTELGYEVPVDTVVSNVVYAPTGNEVLLIGKRPKNLPAEDESVINRLVLKSDGRQTPIDFFVGDEASYASTNTVTYLKKGVVYLYDINFGEEYSLKDIPKIDVTTTKRAVKFFVEQGVLAVSDEVVDYRTLIPKTEIQFYRLEKIENEYKATKVYRTVLTDAEVSGIALSPAGRYLAIATTVGVNQAEPKLLIFDTINGIIKKEIDLSAFVASSLWFDQWVNFDPS